MTVAELIKRLKKIKQDLEVRTADYSDDTDEVIELQQIEGVEKLTTTKHVEVAVLYRNAEAPEAMKP